MTFHITINDVQKADAFATIFQHMKLFTEQVNLTVTAEKIFVQAMDTAHVCVFEITLPSAWFTTYQFDTSRSGVTIGLNSTILYRILNSRDKGQLVALEYTNEDSDKLFIHLTGQGKDNYDKHFEMPLFDIDIEMLSIPEMEASAEFSLTSSNFATIINQLKMFGDCLEFQCSEDTIALSSTSLEFGKMAVEIKIDDLTAFSINEGEQLNLSFSLTYMHNICMYNKIAKEIEIQLTDNFPMKMVYSLGEEAYISFYLAPKIND
jgi:hypothetical protein